MNNLWMQVGWLIFFLIFISTRMTWQIMHKTGIIHISTSKQTTQVHWANPLCNFTTIFFMYAKQPASNIGAQWTVKCVKESNKKLGSQQHTELTSGAQLAETKNKKFFFQLSQHSTSIVFSSFISRVCPCTLHAL